MTVQPSLFDHAVIDDVRDDVRDEIRDTPCIADHGDTTAAAVGQYAAPTTISPAHMCPPPRPTRHEPNPSPMPNDSMPDDDSTDDSTDDPTAPTPPPASDPTPSDAPSPRRFTVEVVRSTRRKRTVGAQLVGGVLRVSVPSWMTRAEEDHWVREMTRRYERAHRTDRIDLAARAASLARRLDLPRPAVVRWGGDMRTQWGSCTPVDRSIRLANRLAEMPSWVLDYVLVHEMAHIQEPNHSPAFWQLVHRYDKAERAIGYLLAKSDDPNDTLEPHDVADADTGR